MIKDEYKDIDEVILNLAMSRSQVITSTRLTDCTKAHLPAITSICSPPTLFARAATPYNSLNSNLAEAGVALEKRDLFLSLIE